MSDIFEPHVICWHDDVGTNGVTETMEPEKPSCQCQSLLAGHDEWCAYHKVDYSDPRTRTDLWGIKRQDTKTRAEVNAKHRTLQDTGYSLWSGSVASRVETVITLEHILGATSIATGCK
jgi:hypothetical protein